jgi:hypothetical protein
MILGFRCLWGARLFVTAEFRRSEPRGSQDHVTFRRSYDYITTGVELAVKKPPVVEDKSAGTASSGRFRWRTTASGALSSVSLFNSGNLEKSVTVHTLGTEVPMWVLQKLNLGLSPGEYDFDFVEDRTSSSIDDRLTATGWMTYRRRDSYDVARLFGKVSFE